MQEPVLVLNANFEPINVCTTRRAVVLILGGKAAMVANGRGYIRTVRELIPRPSVIRLELQIRRPRPRVKLTRREVFRRDNYTCQYCGRRDGGLTVDHVTAPVSGRSPHLDECGGCLPILQPSQRRQKPGRSAHGASSHAKGTAGQCCVYFWPTSAGQ